MERYRAATAAIGYAADLEGRGIAFVTIATGSGRTVLRVPFSATPLAIHEGREIGYAAVNAVAHELRRRGFARIRLRVGNPRVVADLAAPCVVAPALAMAYVKVRCVMNSFRSARVEIAELREIEDLESRARAELDLQSAA